MMDQFQRILVLSPHTDDGELGCGGTLSRFVSEERCVFYAAFSSAEKSIPPGFERDALKKEVRQATAVIRIPPSQLTLLDYPVRDFPQHRQEILEDMIRLRNHINPDLVLLPSTADTHQDHQTISQEGFRAFKQSTMLGFELPWNNLTFQTAGFVALEEAHVDCKVRAIQCYQSQAHRDYSQEEFVRGLARTRGTQIGSRYAEAFEVIRWVIR